MALLDFLKPEEKEKKPSKKKEAGLKPAKKEADVVKPKNKVSGFSFNILSSPHITEKATFLEESNKYIFKVSDKANKTEVRKAVEMNYGVDVLGVSMIIVPEKKRRVGGKAGWSKGYKKAIVSVKQGQKIEIMPR